MADGLKKHKILKFSGPECEGGNNTWKGTNFYMGTMWVPSNSEDSVIL